MMKTKLIALLLGIVILVVSCKDFLALKPETSYSHPETLEDINALLNYESRVNGARMTLRSILRATVPVPRITKSCIAGTKSLFLMMAERAKIGCFPMKLSYMLM